MDQSRASPTDVEVDQDPRKTSSEMLWVSHRGAFPTLQEIQDWMAFSIKQGT